MKINNKKDGNVLTVELEGRLDTNTAPKLDAELSDLDGIKRIVLDLNKLEYISSAGLRVVLMLHKKMASTGGRRIISNPTDDVMDVLDMTGFSTFLTIEEC